MCETFSELVLVHVSQGKREQDWKRKFKDLSTFNKKYQCNHYYIYSYIGLCCIYFEFTGSSKSSSILGGVSPKTKTKKKKQKNKLPNITIFFPNVVGAESVV